MCANLYLLTLRSYSSLPPLPSPPHPAVTSALAFVKVALRAFSVAATQ